MSEETQPSQPDERITYRGKKSDLPAFLPWFKIPMPREWFDVLFKEDQDKKVTIYRADAHNVLTGYTVYDCEEAYKNRQWLDALKK
jgi:hypothetical protein